MGKPDTDIQSDMLDSIAGKIGSLPMQMAVHEKTLIDPKVIMSVLCTAADVLRGEPSNVYQPRSEISDRFTPR